MDAVGTTRTTLFFFTTSTSSSEECWRRSNTSSWYVDTRTLNDCDFAPIEKRKRSSSVLLEDWATVIQGANLRNPFKLTKMKKKDSRSWKMYLEQKYYLQKKDTDGNPVQEGMQEGKQEAKSVLLKGHYHRVRMSW